MPLRLSKREIWRGKPNILATTVLGITAPIVRATCSPIVCSRVHTGEGNARQFLVDEAVQGKWADYSQAWKC